MRAAPAPREVAALADRIQLRRAGRLTPEDEEILRDRSSETWATADRRLADRGLRLDLAAAEPGGTPADDADVARLREALLLADQRALETAWDPSVHLEEAVRAVTDLGRVRNLLGERLTSWVSRDEPEVEAGDAARAVRTALEAPTETEGPLGPSDPGLRAARRRLAELYRATESTQSDLERAVAAVAPNRAPNLSHLLGADLAARLMAQSGGLDRLARLPASTIQVLGAERAFFEHLRGRAPPPRHGLLFLHAAIQSASRSERGKLARALAGKAAIAARMDRAGAALDPSLAQEFERRRAALAARRGEPKGPGRRRSRTAT